MVTYISAFHRSSLHSKLAESLILKEEEIQEGRGRSVHFWGEDTVCSVVHQESPGLFATGRGHLPPSTVAQDSLIRLPPSFSDSSLRNIQEDGLAAILVPPECKSASSSHHWFSCKGNHGSLFAVWTHSSSWTAWAYTLSWQACTFRSYLWIGVLQEARSAPWCGAYYSGCLCLCAPSWCVKRNTDPT